MERRITGSDNDGLSRGRCIGSERFSWTDLVHVTFDLDIQLYAVIHIGLAVFIASNHAGHYRMSHTCYLCS